MRRGLILLVPLLGFSPGPSMAQSTDAAYCARLGELDLHRLDGFRRGRGVGINGDVLRPRHVEWLWLLLRLLRKASWTSPGRA